MDKWIMFTLEGGTRVAQRTDLIDNITQDPGQKPVIHYKDGMNDYPQDSFEELFAQLQGGFKMHKIIDDYNEYVPEIAPVDLVKTAEEYMAMIKMDLPFKGCEFCSKGDILTIREPEGSHVITCKHKMICENAVKISEWSETKL